MRVEDLPLIHIGGRVKWSGTAHKCYTQRASEGIPLQVASCMKVVKSRGNALPSYPRRPAMVIRCSPVTSCHIRPPPPWTPPISLERYPAESTDGTPRTGDRKGLAAAHSVSISRHSAGCRSKVSNLRHT